MAGQRRAAQAAIACGEYISKARRRSRWSQHQLAVKVGISQGYESQIERGEATQAPPEIWFALAVALDVPLKFDFGRDKLSELEDAGHLEIQELMLRLGRRTGFTRTFELPTRPATPALSVDVGLRDDIRRLLVLEECWNTFGNLGASVRNTRRKIVEAEALAGAIGGDGDPYRVAACWIVRDSRRNREIVGRYPEVFESTFTGSSVQWVKALTDGRQVPPTGLGLVCCDPGRGILISWRPTRT
jgi:transcriptional regulator with XRE-family HTH domain